MWLGVGLCWGVAVCFVLGLLIGDELDGFAWVGEVVGDGQCSGEECESSFEFGDGFPGELEVVSGLFDWVHLAPFFLEPSGRPSLGRTAILTMSAGR